MPYNLINRKSGGILAIDHKLWKLEHYKPLGWGLRSKGSKDKTLYIADISTGSTVWNKQVLEYVLNRRLYKITTRCNPHSKIIKVATARGVARSIRHLALNIEHL